MQGFGTDQACSNGPLSVGISLCIFSHGWEVRDDAWHPSIGPFKSWCFFYFYDHLFLFYILLLHYINITNKAAWRSGNLGSGYPFRTWVRIPGPPFLNIIYFQVFQCICQSVIHHTPSLSKRQMAKGARSGGQILRAYHGISQCTCREFQRSNGSATNGPRKLLPTPPNQAQFFYFFILFI